MDDNGGYLCKLPKSAAGNGAIYTSTATAPSADEACNKAQTMAREGIVQDNDRAVGQCACQRRGNTSICRVQSTGPKPDVPAVGTAKGKIREWGECKPGDKDCKPSVRKGTSIGIKG